MNVSSIGVVTYGNAAIALVESGRVIKAAGVNNRFRMATW